MLAGLLDEFDQVKDRIQGWDTTPLVKCKKTLDDYARHHKLTTLTKAGNPKRTQQDVPRPTPQQWSRKE